MWSLLALVANPTIHQLVISADHRWSLSYLSTRSIVQAVPSAISLQTAVLIALTICENKSHVAKTSLSFLAALTRNANLHHHSCLDCFANLRKRVYMQLFSNCVQSLSKSSLGRDLLFFFVQLSPRLGYVFTPAKISRQRIPQQGVLCRRFPETCRPTASPARDNYTWLLCSSTRIRLWMLTLKATT